MRRSAREGLRAHRSQGAGSAIARRGSSVRHYKLEASRVGMAEREESFFERLDVRLDEPVRVSVEEATKGFPRRKTTSAAASALARGLEATRQQATYRPSAPSASDCSRRRSPKRSASSSSSWSSPPNGRRGRFLGLPAL